MKTEDEWSQSASSVRTVLVQCPHQWNLSQKVSNSRLISELLLTHRVHNLSEILNLGRPWFWPLTALPVCSGDFIVDFGYFLKGVANFAIALWLRILGWSPSYAQGRYKGLLLTILHNFFVGISEEVIYSTIVVDFKVPNHCTPQKWS